MAILEFTDITLIRNNSLVLSNLSFSVADGEIVGLVGPSGSGKSSLLRLVNLLDSPHSGKILYQGTPLQDLHPTQLRREIGYVFQKPFLFGSSVEENLQYPYQIAKQPINYPEIHHYLERVNLLPTVLKKKPHELSGGEQQRIALVRSLLVKPKVLLLDEITSALDEENAQRITQLIVQQRDELGLTILFTSHQMAQVEQLADTILSLRDGQIAFWGSKSEYAWERRQS